MALPIAYVLIGLLLFLGALLQHWTAIRNPVLRMAHPLWFDLMAILVIAVAYTVVWPYAVWSDYQESRYPDEEDGWQ